MKKSITIIIIFICSINIILFNEIIEKYNDFKLASIFYGSNPNKVEFKTNDNYGKNLLNLIYNFDEIAIEKDNLYINAYSGKAIYFSNYTYDIPMVEGRFLIKDDFFSYENKIVIGKDLSKLIISIGNKSYIKFNGDKYEVIGIMGYSNRDSILDKSFYINLNSYLNTKNNNLKEILIVNEDTKNGMDLINNIEITFKEVVVYENDSSFFYNLIDIQKSSLIKFCLIIVCMLISTLIISFNYINCKMIEIGIRKLYGATNKDIYIKFIWDYAKILINGFWMSSIVAIFILNFNFLGILGNKKIHIVPFFIVFFIIIVFGVIASYVFIRRINNNSVYSNIKGAENVY